MLVSVYLPCVTNEREKNLWHFQSRLSLISNLYKIEQRTNLDLEFILTGNFNRWDSLLEENQIASYGRQGEAEPLINLMAKLDLQSLLPRETVTYSTRNVFSTINLIFTTVRLAEKLDICKLFECNHG